MLVLKDIWISSFYFASKLLIYKQYQIYIFGIILLCNISYQNSGKMVVCEIVVDDTHDF